MSVFSNSIANFERHFHTAYEIRFVRPIDSSVYDFLLYRKVFHVNFSFEFSIYIQSVESRSKNQVEIKPRQLNANQIEQDALNTIINRFIACYVCRMRFVNRRMEMDLAIRLNNGNQSRNKLYEGTLKKKKYSLCLYNIEYCLII